MLDSIGLITQQIQPADSILHSFLNILLAQFLYSLSITTMKAKNFQELVVFRIEIPVFSAMLNHLSEVNNLYYIRISFLFLQENIYLDICLAD